PQQPRVYGCDPQIPQPNESIRELDIDTGLRTLVFQSTPIPPIIIQQLSLLDTTANEAREFWTRPENHP
ncbi:hypothetical protein KI387_039179, partial [Taxus chinensis]